MIKFSLVAWNLGTSQFSLASFCYYFVFIESVAFFFPSRSTKGLYFEVNANYVIVKFYDHMRAVFTSFKRKNIFLEQVFHVFFVFFHNLAFPFKIIMTIIKMEEKGLLPI